MNSSPPMPGHAVHAADALLQTPRGLHQELITGEVARGEYVTTLNRSRSRNSTPKL